MSKRAGKRRRAKEKEQREPFWGWEDRNRRVSDSTGGWREGLTDLINDLIRYLLGIVTRAIARKVERGSVVGPAEKFDGRRAKVVRLTRYNRGLAPLYFVAVGVGITVMVGASRPTGGNVVAARIFFEVGSVGVTVIGLVLLGREVLWLEVGPCFLVRRGFRVRRYRVDEIERVVLRGSAEGGGVLKVRFADGGEVRVEVRPAKVEGVRYALTEAGVEWRNG